jgi:hypothetical protein
MLTHLRRQLVAGEIPSGEGSVFHFLDIYALGFGLEACGALFLGKPWWWVALGVIGSIFFHLLGTKWPRIKPLIGPRFALAFERITSNRSYRRVIYSAMVIAILVSIGFRIYRHYYSYAIQQSVSAQKTGSSSVMPSPQSSASMQSELPTRPAQGKAASIKGSASTESTQKIRKSSPRIPVRTSGSAPSGAPSTTINSAPNGIAISGGNVQNPTVNNYGPPPVEIRWNVRDVVPPTADGSDTPTPSQFKFEKEVTVMVSAPYTPVSIGVQCDSHLEDASGYLRMYTTAFNISKGIADDGKTAFVYFEGSPATPDQPLIIHIWANQPFSVLKVAQAQIKHIDAPLAKTEQHGTDQMVQSGLIPPSIIPEDPAKAVDAVTRMRHSLSSVLGKKDTVTFLMSWHKDDNTNLVLVSKLLGEACRDTPRQCWFTQPRFDNRDLDRPPIQGSDRSGITVHGPDARALAAALGAWFSTYSTSTFPPELNGYKEEATKEIIWIEIGPGSPWKPTTK